MFKITEHLKKSMLFSEIDEHFKILNIFKRMNTLKINEDLWICEYFRNLQIFYNLWTIF